MKKWLKYLLVSLERNTPDLIPNSSYQRTFSLENRPGHNDPLLPQLFLVLVLRIISSVFSVLWVQFRIYQ